MTLRPWCRRRSTAACCGDDLGTPPVGSSVPQRRAVAAERIEETERIILDGRLDEPAWSRAVPASDCIQLDPDNGKPATEPTEVCILFSQDSLFLGVTCHDSEPEKWLGYQRRRDEFLQADDRFMWTIDTYIEGSCIDPFC